MTTTAALKVDVSIWDTNAVNYLRKMTRQSKFDFTKVAEMMKAYFVENKRHDIDISIDICRKIFAGDFFADAIVPSDTPKLPIKAEKGSINASIVKKVEISNVAEVPQPEVPLNDMSFEEIVAYHAKIDESYTIKHEKLFANVLSSLQGESPVESEGLNDSLRAEIDQFKLQIEERKLAQEAQKLKCERLKKDRKNQLELQRQREALRRRFDDGNPDAIGIDPLNDPTLQHKGKLTILVLNHHHVCT